MSQCHDLRGVAGGVLGDGVCGGGGVVCVEGEGPTEEG